LPLPGPLGIVKAIAYEPLYRMLLIVDEFDGAAGPAIRLLRTTPDGGGLVVWGSWPRVAGTDEVAIASDGTGRLYITASEQEQRHCVMAFDMPYPASGMPLALLGGVEGPGRILTEAIVADPRGLSAAVLTDTMDLLGVRPADLDAPDLEIYERCF
jgi:hypothetical protein